MAIGWNHWNFWLGKNAAHMVCVEATNALDNAYTLKAGESHRMAMTLAVR